MKIGIIGSGIVGQATGIGLSYNGHHVKFHDIDSKRILSLKNKGYDATESMDEVMNYSDMVFVCVPTPTVGDRIELNTIIECTKSMADAIREKNKYSVITFRSTIPPQTSRTKLLPLLEEGSGLKSGADFGVCMNPEFLREKSPLDDFLAPNRIVVGALDRRSGTALKKAYSKFKCPLIVTDLDTAEMIKYTSNTFLAAKISFFNEIFMICRKLGIDENIVSEAAALDSRIGSYGVKGGTPFGGMCLPKDLKAFIHYISSTGFDPVLLKATLQVNERISQYCNIEKEREIRLELPQTC